MAEEETGRTIQCTLHKIKWGRWGITVPRRLQDRGDSLIPLQPSGAA
jgi:hypothetical protein